MILPYSEFISSICQPFEVFRAIERKDIMFLMEIRDRAFPVLQTPRGFFVALMTPSCCFGKLGMLLLSFTPCVLGNLTAMLPSCCLELSHAG